MTHSFKSIHYGKAIPDLSRPFEIICPPETDVWDKPPSTHSFNAPIIYRVIPKSSFKSVKVTVTGDWKHKYDQGGLTMVFDCKDQRRYVKTGIEFYQNKPYVSSVGKDTWSDWSLRPTLNGSESATIEILPYDGALWVYLLEPDGSRVPMREVAWWASIPDDTKVWVGVYAAKPAEEKDDLVVRFEDFEIVEK